MFTWKGWCYQYTRLAFGLTSAGQIFFRCIADVRVTIISRANIISYIDDNLGHAKTFKEYLITFEQMVIAFYKFGLRLNRLLVHFPRCWNKTTKNSTLTSNTSKWTLQQGKCRNEQGKKKCNHHLMSCLDPTIHRLYERVRTDTFSTPMAPVHEINKASKLLILIERDNKVFEKIKKHFSSSPITSFSDFTGLFTTTTDTSDIACKKPKMGEKDHSNRLTYFQPNGTELVYHQTWSIRYKMGLCSHPFGMFTDLQLLTCLDHC